MPKKYTFLLCVVVVVSVGFFTIYPTLGVKQWVKSISQREVQSDIDKKSSEPDNMESLREYLPKFYDEDNPQSNGIFIDVKYPLLTPKQKNILLQKAEKEGFKIIEQWDLRAWTFLWDKWYPISKAEKQCKEFKNISFVVGCEVNTLFVPESIESTSNQKKKMF